MEKPKIVFADNDKDFLEIRREMLERVGMEVIPVTTVSQARSALSRTDIDLAILDIRLDNNDDEKDITGLLLAAEDSFFSVPKIILTAYTNQQGCLSLCGQLAADFPAILISWLRASLLRRCWRLSQGL